MSSSRHPALHGLVLRSLAIVLGVAIAGAGIVAMQLPLLHQAAQADVRVGPVPAVTTSSLDWPSVGSAALDIPSLGILVGHDDEVVPIASLTKMMTVYVALQDLPLSMGETGPCHTVTEADLATYRDMSAIDESSVPVALGEQLCENELLEGVLVHSAGNYAVMLANMVTSPQATFIGLMNQEAITLKLRGTHYADVTGFSPQSVSTAYDQVQLAALLMRSPLVRSIVIQPSVTLPVAGTEDSFTPDVGVDGVIGVKSGRTAQAGGCDAMAMTFRDGSTTHVVYDVVLGQQGGNLLTPAGEAALALANSAVSGRVNYTLAKGRVFGSLRYSSTRVDFGLTNAHTLWWRPGQTISLHVLLRRFTRAVHTGDVVGRLVVSGARSHTYLLRSFGDLTPPSLVDRLR